MKVILKNAWEWETVPEEVKYQYKITNYKNSDGTDFDLSNNPRKIIVNEWIDAVIFPDTTYYAFKLPTGTMNVESREIYKGQVSASSPKSNVMVKG